MVLACITRSCYWKWSKATQALGMSSKPLQQSQTNNKWCEKPMTSLERKWEITKHDISKFVGCFGCVVALNKLGSSLVVGGVCWKYT